jgi:hypothetical protein
METESYRGAKEKGGTPVYESDAAADYGPGGFDAKSFVIP